MQRALEIAEEPLGSSHPNVVIPLNNLAQLLQDRSCLDAINENIFKNVIAVYVDEASNLV